MSSRARSEGISPDVRETFKRTQDRLPSRAQEDVALNALASGDLNGFAHATNGNKLHGKARQAIKDVVAYGGLNGTNGHHAETIEHGPDFTIDSSFSPPESISKSEPTIIFPSEPTEASTPDEEEVPSFGPHININMFNPDPSNVEMADLLSDFYGSGTVIYAAARFMSSEEKEARKLKTLERSPKTSPKKYHSQKQKIMRGIRSRVEPNRIASSIAEQYALKDDEEPLSFLEAQMLTANSVHRQILDNTAPEYEGVLGLKTEPSLIITDPEQLFEFTFDAGIDERTQWEVRRQLLTAIPSAEIDIYRRRSGLDKHLRRVVSILDNDQQGFFVGKKGASQLQEFVVVHDKLTNRALRYVNLTDFKGGREDIPHDSEYEVLRNLPMDMRRLKSGKRVFFEPRIKETGPLKAIQEAVLEYEKGAGDGTVLPLKYVRDLVGMMFIVDDQSDDKVVDDVMYETFACLEENNICLKVKEDHKTNGTEDQSKDFRFKRLQLDGIGDDGLPIRYEIIFQGVVDFANSVKMVGSIDEDKGRYMGPWHDGYDTERLILGNNGGVAKLYFPDEIFKRGKMPVDVVEQAKITKNRKAKAQLQR